MITSRWTPIVVGLAMSLGTIEPLAAQAPPVPEERTTTESGQRWSAGAAWAWYRKQPWLVGFNCIPAAAINTTEMWQKDTLAPVTIDRELALAHGIGFNCVRVFVQYIVWEDDLFSHQRFMSAMVSLSLEKKTDPNA